jgi:pantoate--beta-alanine ligase
VRTIRTIAELRAALAPARRDGASIGLVPTMGAFHEGHLSLMRRAREQCDLVVVSLFVNPTQFNEQSDLDAYPREEARDVALAAELGVDLLFAPAPEEIYPRGFATTVVVHGAVSETLEGAQRGRSHFDGVATVVTKLLNIVAPDIAYFGQKDAQQTVVIRRLVRDLEIPVRIEVCPTVRDRDGLALSSRNARLAPEERARATALHRSLQAAEAAVRVGETDAAAISASALARLRAGGVEPEYFALVDPRTLTPLERLDRPALALVAARVGATRLIDNRLLSVPGASGTVAASTLSDHNPDPTQEVPACTAR